MNKQVENSDQEWLKQADDAVNKFRHLLECWKDRLTFDNLRLSERYFNSQLEILVRLAVVGIGGNVDYFIAHHKRDFGPFLERDNHSSASIDRPLSESCSCGDQDSVFIETVQLMDVPESVVSTRVRLYREQDFIRPQSHLIYFSLGDGRCVLLGGLNSPTNGKERMPVRFSSSGFDKLPSEMVECASEVMNDIPDNHRQIFGNGLHAFDIKSRVMHLGYRVRLGSNFIRLVVSEQSDPMIKFTDMLFGPFNFEPNSVNSVPVHTSEDIPTTLLEREPTRFPLATAGANEPAL